MPQKYYEVVMVHVEAIQVSNETAEAAGSWCRGVFRYEIDNFNPDNRYLVVNVPTAGGVERASTGWYIVKDATGKFSVMSPTEFENKYKRVEE
jgi:hypothetical protein